MLHQGEGNWHRKGQLYSQSNRKVERYREEIGGEKREREESQKGVGEGT